MQNDIFGLLMMILMLENGGSTENVNQMVIMFLMLQNMNGDAPRTGVCRYDDGYTF